MIKPIIAHAGGKTRVCLSKSKRETLMWAYLVAKCLEEKQNEKKK